MADEEDAPPARPSGAFTVYDHPSARRSIERTRSWAALTTFAVVTGLSMSIGVEDFTAVVRGLVAGIIMFVLAWAIAVTVWKEIVRTELTLARDRAEQRRAEALRAIEEAREAQLELVRQRRAAGG